MRAHQSIEFLATIAPVVRDIRKTIQGFLDIGVQGLIDENLILTMLFAGNEPAEMVFSHLKIFNERNENVGLSFANKQGNDAACVQYLRLLKKLHVEGISAESIYELLLQKNSDHYSLGNLLACYGNEQIDEEYFSLLRYLIKNGVRLADIINIVPTHFAHAQSKACQKYLLLLQDFYFAKILDLNTLCKWLMSIDIILQQHDDEVLTCYFAILNKMIVDKSSALHIYHVLFNKFRPTTSNFLHPLNGQTICVYLALLKNLHQFGVDAYSVYRLLDKTLTGKTVNFYFASAITAASNTERSMQSYYPAIEHYLRLLHDLQGSQVSNSFADLKRLLAAVTHMTQNKNIAATKLFLSLLLSALQQGEDPTEIYAVLADNAFRHALEKANDAKTILQYLYLVVSLNEKHVIDWKKTDKLVRSVLYFSTYRNKRRTVYSYLPLLDRVLQQHTQPQNMYPLLCEEGLFHPVQMNSMPDDECKVAYRSIAAVEEYCSKERMFDYIMTFPVEQQREALTNALTKGHPLHAYFNVQRGLLKARDGHGMFGKIKAALDALNLAHPPIVLVMDSQAFLNPVKETVKIEPIVINREFAITVPNTTQYEHVAVHAASALQQVELYDMANPHPPAVPVLLSPTKEQQQFFATGVSPSVSAMPKEAPLIMPANNTLSVLPTAPTLTNQAAEMIPAPASVLSPTYIAMTQEPTSQPKVSSVNMWQEKPKPNTLETNMQKVAVMQKREAVAG